MYAHLNSAVINGVNGLSVEIEAKLTKGIPSYHIVGLPDKTVRESKERIRSAIESLGIRMPAKRMTLNLVPAEIPKDGGHLDLPMALGLLFAMGEITSSNTGEMGFFGELTLDGRILPSPGILAMVSSMRDNGVKYVVVPYENRIEASLVKGIQCYPAKNLSEVYELFCLPNPERKFSRFQNELIIENRKKTRIDFKEVIGQEMAKRALMISAAGQHNILISGPPGSGKSMMFKAFEAILPDMEYEEAIEVKRLHGSREIQYRPNLTLARPFRQPHANITLISMIGGGRKPKPGEITMAHNGVLYLDELLEYKRDVIEALRQPLEDGEVSVVRLGNEMRMPARFLLAASMNPCKCGYLYSMDKVCTCSDGEIKKYLGKISGPMLDRIDILVEVQSSLNNQKKRSLESGLSTEEMLEKVKQAVAKQSKRYENTSIRFNGHLDNQLIKTYCYMTSEAENLLSACSAQYKFSKRTEMKLYKISRTIADLDGEKNILLKHVAEAVQYRIPESRLRRSEI